MSPRLMVGARRWRRADERGTALVEFALVLPLVLLLLFAMIDFGKAMNYWNDETHLANEAARQAAVNRCPSCGAPINDWIKTRADSNELKNGSSGSISPPGLDVCIWFPNGTHEVGDPVQVIVRARYNWLGYLVKRWNIIPHSSLRGAATMRLEQPYKADGIPNDDAFYTGPSTSPNWTGTGTC